jgi:TonB family protein
MQMILMAMLLAGQMNGQAAPLEPVSPWRVKYTFAGCLASRGYGDEAHPVVIGFEPETPITNVFRMMVIGDRAKLGKDGVVNVTLDVSGKAVAEKLPGKIVRLSDGRAALTFSIPRTTFQAFVDEPRLVVRASRRPAISVALLMGKALLDAAGQCEADTQERLGFDPKKIAAVATPAEGIKGESWLDWTDYPASAISARQQGAVLAGWTISAEGRITDCRPLRSSGWPDLDRASCTSLTTRGRYRPALDASGRPIESYATMYVQWQLPSEGTAVFLSNGPSPDGFMGPQAGMAPSMPGPPY